MKLTKQQRTQLLTRATVVQEHLTSKGVTADLVGVSALSVSFTFRIHTGQDVGPILEELFERWPDVADVNVNEGSGRAYLTMSFFDQNDEGWKD